MTSRVWRSHPVFLALVAMISISSVRQAAHAADNVAALGVRSLDGEDELERRLAGALLASAKSMNEFAVSDRDVSLEQLLLAQGCDEPDAPCLAEIARSLTVDKLLYGTVTSADGAYELTLSLFDASSRRSTSAVAKAIPADQLTTTTALDTVYKLLRRLLGKEAPPSSGTLRVTGQPGQGVLVDGVVRGALNDRGALTLELSPGKHTVRPAGSEYSELDDRLALIVAGAEDHVQLTASAVAAPSQPPNLNVIPSDESAPPAPPAHRLRRTLGWASVGLGAAFAIATVYSWVRIEHINHDGSYREYRGAFPKAGTPGGVSDVCGPASRGELVQRDGPTQAGLERKAKELCDEANTLEALQYVFLSGALIGAGAGTYLLLTSRNKAQDKARASMRFSPRFGAQSAGLAATLTF